ncbi:S8 family serine peptidase [Natronosporangium hydrolyticum]|uniref:S8 family serine peptidase n=1 Tax=Natronosporangium hydrolyticum TaxID=2811111 RepID=A0A895YC08_9ACTN|nr:S8 family serine peptidase [Natronosporangium hydrolyticum]QSB13752.1 S8 family serine peptidase [Natronosporangium hydrolyticum]
MLPLRHRRRGRLLVALLATGAATATTLLLAAAPVAASPVAPQLPAEPPTPLVGGEAEPESGLWLVRLAEPSLAAAAAADRPELAAAGELDVAAPASVSYLDHLTQRQETVQAEIETTLGRSVEVVHAYRNVVNALAIDVTAAEAAQLTSLTGVDAIEADQALTLETDVSHELIHSDAVWQGETGDGVGTRGEGVIVGVLDTGVNPHHPSFAAVDGDGYQHTNPYGEGVYAGVCDPAHPQHDEICNDKLIGAWAMTGTSARDDNNHGSHVGATIAGNRHEAQITVGDDTHPLTVAGVAPRANVISYKVCAGISCFASASIAAVDQAITDGVDVLNYSISGPDDPWGNTVDQAFLEAYAAGVFVAASAGNDGPGADTVAKTAPWNATVAATTHHRLVAHRLDVTAPTPVPAPLTGIAAVAGEGSPSEVIEGELRDVADLAGDRLACTALPADSLTGAVALVERGDCNFSVKVGHAATAGAVGVIVSNQYAGPPLTMGALENAAIPAVMIGLTEGELLREQLADADGEPVEVHVGTGSELLLDPDWADIVADFSSRGPSQFDLLAPTVAAPGRNILAAFAESGDDPDQYGFLQGTSMSSPQVAGAGALLAALHPQWSPAQIRSALAVTADRDGLLKEDGVTPADPFDVGSGRINLERAGRAGLTFDEHHDNFVAANPATGGDPRTLNLPAIVDQHCDQTCTFTREVTGVAGVSAGYAVESTAPAGVSITVEPAEFTLAPGASQRLEITVDVAGLVRGDWLFGAVDLTTDADHGADGPAVAGAHLPVALLPAAPELTVAPESLASLLDVAQTESHLVTVGNDGGAELTWQLGCDLPDWATVSPDQGTLAPFSEQQLEVVFDTSELPDGGEFTGELCLDSDDPHRPTASVALELTVVPVPVIDVNPAAVSALQPAGLATEHDLAISNVGHGVLEWTLADETAGASDERLDLLRDGVLLIPNSSAATRGVMAFDPHTGDLLDPEFVPHHAFDPSSTLYTPFHIIAKPDGSGFLMSDQVRWVVTEYDLEGNFRGVFAPDGGRNPEIMGNTRGMALSPHGTVLVTVAAQDNAHSVVEFDLDGNFLGTFIEPGLGGMQGPWGILIRDDDVLVSASNSSAVHSFSADGATANPIFADEFNWPGQLHELPDGNVLAASYGGGGDTAGVKEYTADGELVGVYTGGGNGHQGVHPLGNGNLLTTNSGGVHEIDRAGNLVATKHDQGQARFITHVQLPDAQPCLTPDEVPWLSVSAASGQTGAAQTTDLTVTLDSADLAPGTHEVQLCVVSNDPATPLVPVPVSVTVIEHSCDRVVDGEHHGPLAVRGGVTCLLPGTVVHGPVAVQPGAGLVAADATVAGQVTVSGAATVDLTGVEIRGPLSVTGVTGSVSLAGSEISGPVSVTNNRTGQIPTVVSGNQIGGPLRCAANQPAPTNLGVPNTVAGPTSGQCAAL